MIGIYKITNLINNKIYIGQSWDIENRWKNEKKGKINSHIKSSFKKYGIDNFEFEILRTFSNSGLTQIFLDLFEKKYIEEYKTYDRNFGYNKTHGGSFGRLSEDIIDKIRYKLKGSKQPNISKKLSGVKKTEQHKKKLSEANVGKKLSQETKDKISKNSIGKKRTEETKNKMSESFKGRIFSEEHKRKIGESKKNISEQTRNKMRESAKNRDKVRCPYCNKIGLNGNMKRWHFENCRYKNV